MINCLNAEIGEANGVRRLKYIAKILLTVISILMSIEFPKTGFDFKMMA